MKKTTRKIVTLLITMSLVITSTNFLSIQTVYAIEHNPELCLEEMTIAVGKTHEIVIVNVAPWTIEHCEWSSNKPKIAKASKNGVIKGLKKGVATITCKIKFYDTEDVYIRKCKITVKDNIPVTITGTEGKDPNDVEILSNIIKDLIASGAEVYTDLNYVEKEHRVGWEHMPDGYTWNEEGRLTSIGWYNTELSGKLDVSKLTALEILDCTSNALRTVKVNPQIKVLRLSNNRITKINLSKCKKLEELGLRTNRLTTLNISKCKQLRKLYCDDNKLKTLNLSKNKKLQHLSCYNTLLKTLDISKNTQLIGIVVSSKALKKLDISKNTKLKELSCHDCNLSELDTSNNPELFRLACYRNNIDKLDLSNNPKLLVLNCDSNKLTKLDLSKNPEIIELSCTNNKLTTLDISKCSNLTDKKLKVDSSVRIIR